MATHVEMTVGGEMPAIIIPPLESGDRLSRAEFERRYGAMPNLKKAELIEGVVYVTPPLSVDHGRPNSRIAFLLVAYSDATPGVDTTSNTTVRLDPRNEPQPDVLLRIEADYGGQSRIGPDRYVEGPPELIFEIASSSVSYDLHDKLNAYRKAGVREYIVWRVRDEDIDWFVLREGRYDRLVPDAAGVFRSEVFPGFWFDRSAALRGDAAAMMVTLQQGIASPEHAAFVARLQQTAAASRK